MRMTRMVPLLLVAALAACEAGSKYQGGDPDEQGAQGSEEKGINAAVNDTAPHRPGAGDPGDVSENKPENPN